MLKYYRVYSYVTYPNAKKEEVHSGGRIILEETEAQDHTINVNWENVEKVSFPLDGLFPFMLFHRKKGKMLTHLIEYRHFKEWKHPNLNITVEIQYKPIQASIQDILDYHDSDIAIAFLKERGINVVG